MQKLDAKFYVQGNLRKAKNDAAVPDDEWMLFLAQDNAFAAVLPVYREICIAMGADEEHLDAVDRTIERLHKWRLANPDRCKVPDAAGERLLA